MIKLEGLSKVFRLYHGGAPTLKSYFLSLAGRRLRWEKLYALRDIDLEIKAGEFFGVIGPNGSGKSTLLKILAGILYPTSGSLKLQGEISPFLELGVGFQGELTGRENVFLYGAVRGLTRRQISQRYDEIVAFSELDKFMDTKLKHYSSGMQVRLAFATSIQTPAEIFLIDEVLAVGDAGFQKKCFEVFDQFKKDGRTIVYVSHSLDTIRRFCDRAAFLDKGQLIYVGEATKAVARYVCGPETNAAPEAAANPSTAGPGQRLGAREVEITRVRLLDKNGEETSQFPSGGPITIEATYRLNRSVPLPIFSLAISRLDGTQIYSTNTNLQQFSFPWPPAMRENNKIYFKIPWIPVLKGDFLLAVTFHDEAGSHHYDWHSNIYRFSVFNATNQIGEINFQGNFSLI